MGKRDSEINQRKNTLFSFRRIAMAEKVSVKCPKCGVRLRMPLGLRAGKKPRCPKCKTIVRPADVLPPHLATPKPTPVPPPPPQKIPTPSELFTETRTLIVDGSPRLADPYADTRTKLPVEEEAPAPPTPRVLATPTPSDFFNETRTLVPNAEPTTSKEKAESDLKLPDEPPMTVPPSPKPVLPGEDRPAPDISDASIDDDDPPPWVTAAPKPKAAKPVVPVGLEETRIPLPGELPSTGVPFGLEETRIPLPGEWPPKDGTETDDPDDEPPPPEPPPGQPPPRKPPSQLPARGSSQPSEDRRPAREKKRPSKAVKEPLPDPPPISDRAALESTVPRDPTRSEQETPQYIPGELDTAVQSPEQAAAKLAELSRRGKLPTIPGYKILSLLGQGGMGVVYHVEQIGLKREAALKMILGGQYSDENSRARFRVEAEAIAQLRHPNVVQVYGFGEHEGLPYLALEYVDGATLGHKLRRDKSLREEDAATLLLGIAEGVAHAHAKGIIHRDLKPVNVLLAKDGTPKVADFGLARLENQELTSTGALLGTPSYMPPEQASGRVREIGPASDVYALGAMLFEMLAGRPPFKGDSPFEIIRKVIEEDAPSLRRFAPRVPRDLETICQKCLAKDPARRYPSAKELADDLRRWRAGEPVQARRASRVERTWKHLKRNKPAVLAGSAVAAAVLVVIAALVFGSRTPTEPNSAVQRPPEEPQSFARLVDRGTKLIEDGDPAGALLWFARADAAAATADPERAAINKHRISVLLDRAIPLVHRFRHTARVTAVEIAPDGRTILTAAEDRTAIVHDLAGGKAIAKVELASPIMFATFNADGSRFAALTKDRHAHVFDAATGKRLAGPLYHPVSLNVATFSPDGRTLATGGGALLYEYAVTVTVPRIIVEMRVATEIQNVSREVDVLENGQTVKKTVVEPVTVQKQVPVERTVYETRTEKRTNQRGERESGYTANGGIVSLWDVATGRPAQTIAVGDIVNRLAFAPNGRTLAIGLDTFVTPVFAPPAPPAVIPAPAPANDAPKTMPKPEEAPKKKAAAEADFERPAPDGRSYARFQPMEDAPVAIQPAVASLFPSQPVQFWNLTAATPNQIGSLPLANVPPTPQPLAVPGVRQKPPPRVAHLSFNAVGHVRAAVDGYLYEFDPRSGIACFEPAALQGSVRVVRVLQDLQSSQVFSALTIKSDVTDIVTVTPQRAVVTAPEVNKRSNPAIPAPATFVNSTHLPFRADIEVTDAILIDPFGRLALTASRDNRLRIWDLPSRPTSQTEAETIVLPAAPGILAADPIGRYFAASTADHAVSVWDSYGLEVLPPDYVVRDETPNRSLALSPDGKFAYTSRTNGPVQAWDTATGKTVIDGGPNNTAFVTAWGGETLVVARNDRIEAYRVGQSSPVARFENKNITGGNCCVHVATDGRSVFAHARFGQPIQCLLGDVTAGTARVWTETQPIVEALFSPDGTRLYFTGTDGKIRIRSTATGQPADAGEFTAGQVISAVTFSPDGKTLVVSDETDSIKFFDAATGTVNAPPLPSVVKGSSTLGFDARNRYFFALASEQQLATPNELGTTTVQLWDWPAKTPRGEHLAIPGTGLEPQFDPEGRWVLLRAWRGFSAPDGLSDTIVASRFYDLEPNKLTPLEPWQFRYESDARLGARGELLYASFTEFGAAVFRHQHRPTDRSAEALTRLATLVAGRAIDSTGELAALDATELDERLEERRVERARNADATRALLADEWRVALDDAVTAGNWSAADGFARRLAAEFPEGDHWPLVGDVRAARGDWTGAQTAFETALRRGTDAGKSRVKLAMVHFATGQEKAALAVLEPLRNDPNRPMPTQIVFALAPGLDKAALDALAASPPTARGIGPADVNHPFYGFYGGRFAAATIRMRSGQPDDAIALSRDYSATASDWMLASIGHARKGEPAAALTAEQTAERLLRTPLPSDSRAANCWEIRTLASILRAQFQIPAPATPRKES
jgi:WD40 repeat protein